MESDLIAFLEAIDQAFPRDAKRDRWGRYLPGEGDSEPLRQLAMKYQVDGAWDRADQAGLVARAILNKSRE